MWGRIRLLLAWWSEVSTGTSFAYGEEVVVETQRLGRTGEQVPIISLGTWSHGGPKKAGDRDVGWTGFDLAAQRMSLIKAYDAHITHWDTADVYGEGRSESLIGSVFDEIPRSDVFLASKVGWDPGSFGHFYHPEQIRTQLEGTLARTRTNHLDLYYLHHCDFGPEDVYRDDAVEVLVRAREAGKIRFIGLSDWSCERLSRHVEAVDPDVVQVHRSVVHDTYASSGLKALVEARDLGVAFFSCIRHGLLLGKYETPVTFPSGDYRANDPWFSDAEIIGALRLHRDALAERFSDWSEPVLGPLVTVNLRDCPTGCVLLGQRNTRQVAAAAAAGRVLTAADASWVRARYEALRDG